MSFCQWKKTWCWPALLACTGFLAVLLLSASSARAQVPDGFPGNSPDVTQPSQAGSLRITGELWGRGEGWNWFEGDTSRRYGFGQSLLRLGITQHRNKFDWGLVVAQPSLFALPDNAFDPRTNSAVGLGGVYFAANGNARNVAGLFVEQGYVAIRGIDRNHSTLRLGRFRFADGLEKSPTSPDLAWLQQQRVAQRLIGDSYWTGISRSFDGAHFSSDIGHKTNVTLLAARTSKGVFQTDAMGELDVDIFYGAFSREFPTPHTDSQLRFFALGYHDGRNVLKADNRSLAAREADTSDIRIGTFGVSYALVTPLPHIGKWDLVVWGAQQIGHWGVLTHRANSGTFELGWRPPIGRIHPWLRAGAFFSSGDANPNDGKHTTFFQPLPTQQLYARMPFYTLENTEDYTGQVIVQPTKKLGLRTEIHKVKLHQINDAWYLGTGAFQNTSFGYDALANNHHRGLGNYVDINASYSFNPHFEVSYYIGAMSGKGAETDRLKGRKSGFTYLEMVYRF
ncbi:MAG TPA: alginate export family protein [Terriglobales bacterium]|nr:alginate export family protein [Terriglobales bacterium]